MRTGVAMPDFTSTPAGLLRLVREHGSAILQSLGPMDASDGGHAGICRPSGGGSSTIWISGELDDQSAPELLDHLTAVEIPPGGTMILVLSRVSFVDVAGVLLLLEVHDRLTAEGVCLILRAPARCVSFVLAVTGCTDVFTIATGPRGHAVDRSTRLQGRPKATARWLRSVPSPA